MLTKLCILAILRERKCDIGLDPWPYNLENTVI